MSNQGPDSNFKKKGHFQKVPRVELFSDAVFAIAITLLIINCIETRHPSVHHLPLFESLREQWPIFLCFIVAFYTILVCWFNHYLIYKYVERFNGALLWANGFVLLIITIIPFPTVIISERIQTNGHNALIFCGIIYLMMALSFHLLWRTVRKNKLYFPKTSAARIRSFTFLYRTGVLYTALALFICWASPVAGIILYMIMFLILGFPKKIMDLSFRYEALFKKKK